MKGRRVWEIGGFISGAVLIVFGAVALSEMRERPLTGAVLARPENAPVSGERATRRRSAPPARKRGR